MLKKDDDDGDDEKCWKKRIARDEMEIKLPVGSVRLVLWDKVERVRGGSEEDFGDFYPVVGEGAGEECFEVAAAAEAGHAVVDVGREDLEEADGDVLVEEGEPVAEEAAGVLDALGVGAPVLEAVVAKVGEHVEALAGADVPEAVLLDLGEDPRLGERGARD